MAESKPINCNAGCKKEFVLKNPRIKKVKKGIEKTYFNCPYCNHEYIAYYTSPGTLKLQREIRKLYTKLKGSHDKTEEVKALLEEIDCQTEKIKESMKEARELAEQ